MGLYARARSTTSSALNSGSGLPVDEVADVGAHQSTLQGLQDRSNLGLVGRIDVPEALDECDRLVAGHPLARIHDHCAVISAW